MVLKHHNEKSGTLLDGMMASGLSVLQIFLQKEWGRPWALVNGMGQTLCSSREKQPAALPELQEFPSVPVYRETSRELIYPVHSRELQVDLYYIMQQVPAGKRKACENVLELTEAAVLSYFGRMEDSMRHESLYFPSPVTFPEFSSLMKSHLKDEGLYCVCAAHADVPVQDDLWRGIYDRIYRTAEINHHRLLPLGFDNWIIGVLYAGADQDHLSIEYQAHLGDGKTFFDRQLMCCCSVSTGTPRPLAELWKSYREALYALAVGYVFGQREFYRNFSDLGVFSLLLNQERSDISRFCHRLTDPLADYDKAHGTELLHTLQVLSDTSYGIKEASAQLNINKTTLYYRMNRISELTGLDITKGEGRLNAVFAEKGLRILSELEDFDR